MSNFDQIARSATAAIGALLLSTLTVFAVAVPAETAQAATAFAAAGSTVANG